MENQIDYFLKQIEGRWISQKTTYYMQKTKLYANKSKNKIITVNNKVANTLMSSVDSNLYTLCNSNLNTNKNDSTLFLTDSSNKKGSIVKIKPFTKYNGIFKIDSNNCLKIEFTYNRISYTEYLYLITKNFHMHISLIKLKSRYIAVTFTSCIKI
uniref:Chromophore lyase CpcS/CpeS n=1 Tax=Rhodymenia pseudopalmata TaxID=31502 RepID=A0A1C9C7I1_RHOPU|nr:hypothetical protein Rhodyp_053 [Rhodymenia pseudopalmata]AOM64331.1 hypothetical protein Rhodyp_053 [Rhodymenia pseudopalmata]